MACLSSTLDLDLWFVIAVLQLSNVGGTGRKDKDRSLDRCYLLAMG